MKRLVAGCVVAALAAVLLADNSHSAERKVSSRAGSTAIAQTATPVDAIQSLPGFQVERLYSVPAEQQGSWVALTVDDKGRLITSDQYGASTGSRRRRSAPVTSRALRSSMSTSAAPRGCSTRLRASTSS